MSVSEVELNDIKERFDLFDKKGDGKVDNVQVIDVLRACGLNPRPEQVNKVIEDSDLKGKRIDLKAFCDIYAKLKKTPGNANFDDLMEAFKTFDRDQNGTISAAELHNLLVTIGDTLTAEQADMIVSATPDESGSVAYPDLIKSLMDKSV